MSGNERAEEQEPTERTSLLNRIRHGRRPLDESDDEDAAPTKASQHRTLTITLLYLGLSLIVILLLCLAIIHFIAGRTLQRINAVGYEAFAQQSLVYQGPQDVSLDEVQDDALHLTISYRAGLDIARGLQWDRSTLINRIQDSMTRYGVKRTKRMSVDMPNGVMLSSTSPLPSDLFSVTLKEPLSLPVKYGMPKDDLNWLQDVQMPLKVKLLDPKALASLAKLAWNDKQAIFQADVDKTTLSGSGILKMFGALNQFSLDDLKKQIDVKVPDLPFLDDLSSLVNLSHYTIQPYDKGNQSRLDVLANATIYNPLYIHRHQFPSYILKYLYLVENKTFQQPYHIPFNASLLAHTPDSDKTSTEVEIPFGQVALQPFAFNPLQRNISISLAGSVTPASNETSVLLQAALSDLLARYLAGKKTPLHVRPSPSTELPSFMNDMIKQVSSLAVELPGSPDPDAELLKNVRIENLAFDGTGPNSEILCSGIVVGELFLPDGLEGLSTALNITSLWPDILVFDGKSPSNSLPPHTFPPSPLPPRAFARVHPDNWSVAHTRVVTTPQKKKVTQVQMQLRSVPFQVLPGRSDIFRSYLAKVILQSGSGPGGKVETGIQGFSKIRTTMTGLGSLQLDGIAVRGTFFVGRSGI